MKDISFSGVHRRGTWVGPASRTPFYRQVLEDVSQSEVTAEDIAQQCHHHRIRG